MRDADGWKPLKDMLGKVVVVLHESTLAKDYIKLDETMRTQAMFPSVLYKDRDIAQAGFILENNPKTAVARIDFYREQNYVVRTRADVYPKFTDKKYDLRFLDSPHATPPNYSCISFTFDSKEEIDALYQQHQQIALAPPREHPLSPVYSFFVMDPNGLRVEFQVFI